MNDYKNLLALAFVLGALSACGSFYQSQLARDSALPLDTGAVHWRERVQAGRMVF